MIRVVFALRRLPHLSREEFQNYWRHNHGPLVAGHSTTLRMRRYVQSHTLEDPMNDVLRKLRGTMEPFDGVAEVWLNNLEELIMPTQTAEGKAAARELVEDEKKFIDLARSPIYLATELPQINPTPENIVARAESPIIKICYFGRALPTMTTEQAQLYWRMNHGPLVRSLAPARRMKRYFQVHQLPTPLNDLLRKARGTTEENFIGHAEAWYDRVDLAAANATPEGARSTDLLVQDEAKFFDLSRSTVWIAKEYVYIDR